MYIRSTGNISPQRSFGQVLNEPTSYSGEKLSCIEPDYSSYIDPKQIRRMSRIIKMGVAAAFDCLKDSGVSIPDAIITGTAYGCLADTDIFLTRLVENKEELLSPTAFIQSTHNTVGAQIALLLKCHNYNNTFVHRGFSFESALLDGITMINEGSAPNALIGGVDEIIDTSHALLRRFGLYKTNNDSSLELLQTNSKGTVNGEGAAFFLLQKEKSNNDQAKLDALSVFYKPSGINEIEKKVISFLEEQQVQMKDIGLVIAGNNGDVKNDTVYKSLARGVFANKAVAGYKHLCGEYPTSSAFALWLAANILKTGKVPEICNAGITGNPGKILIYNHYQHIHHSLYLLSAC